jgi:hypothetical protein
MNSTKGKMAIGMLTPAVPTRWLTTMIGVVNTRLKCVLQEGIDMKAIEFEGQDLMLNPPPGTARGTCGALPVKRCDGRMVSVWKLEPGDLEQLQNGAHVLLHVWGKGHPPVGMSIQKMDELP